MNYREGFIDFLCRSLTAEEQEAHLAICARITRQYGKLLGNCSSYTAITAIES